jgi:hypothetical protein
LGLVGILAGVGCGGSSSPKLSGRLDGGMGGSMFVQDGALADGSPAIPDLAISRPDLPQGPSLRVSPAALPFGEIDVGQASPALTVTVTNTGALTALTPTVDVAAFSITGTTCSTPAASCTISIVFTPPSAAVASGTLIVAPGLTVSLSGTGSTPRAFTATPSAIPGTVLANQTVPFTVTVTATGAIPGLGCVPSSANVTADPTKNTCLATVLANTPCAFGFTFKAATAGDKTETIVCSGGTTVRNVTVTTTVVTPASLTIVPNPGIFSTGVGTTSQVVTFSVGNAGGSASGILSAAIGGANATEFVITNDGCALPLDSRATCTIQVVFKPTTPGANKAATITVTDATAGSTPATAALSGNGIAGATATITGTGNLGSTVVGKPAVTTLTVTNSGGTATGPLALAAGDPQFVPGTGCNLVQLAPGLSCTVTLTFTPTSAVATSSVLTVSSAGTTLGTFQIQGTGTTPPTPPVLSMTPTQLDFGTIGVGTNSNPQTFTITNTGGTASGALTVTNAGVGGASQFAYTSTCQAALAPGAACQVIVTYKPQSLGGATANFTVNDPTVTSPTRPVSGNAIERPTLTVNCATTTTPFEDTVVGDTSTPRSCTVANDSGSVQDTGIITVTMTGDFSTTAAGSTCGPTTSLAPGLSCTVAIVFKPTARGTRPGTIAVTGANGGADNKNLTGTGLGVVEIQEFTANAGSYTPTPVTGGNFDFQTVSAGATSDNSVILAVYVRGPGVANLKVNTVNFGTASDFTQIKTGAGSIVDLTWPGTADHVIVNPCIPSYTGTLQVSKTIPYCTMVVQFTPQSRTPVAKAGSVTAVAADATMTDTAKVQGAAAGPISVTPSPLDFGPVAKGTEGTAVTLTVCNNSTADNATGTSFTITGTNAAYFAVSRDEFTGVTIAGGNCALLAVRVVVPANAAVGPLSATLTVHATVNGAAENDTSLFTGSVVGSGPVLVATPASPAFAGTPITATSAAVVLTVSNTGDLDTDALTFTVPNGSEFSMTKGSCGGTGCTSRSSTCTTPALAAGTHCTMNLFFKPTGALGLGGRTDILTVFSDNAGIQTLTLTGSATSQITASTGTVTLATSGLHGVASPAQTVTITNYGDAIGPGRLAFPFTDFGSQSGSGDFQVDTTNCDGGLAAGGETCTVSVHMNAASLGTWSTTMVVRNLDDNGQGTNVVVTGTAAEAVLVFTPATDVVRDFGTVRKGDVSAPLTYTVRNVGGLASGVITFALYEDNAGTIPHAKTSDFPFTGSTCGVTGTSDGKLAAGASCNIQVAFSPTNTTATPIPDEYLIVKATPGPVTAPVVSKKISAAAADNATVYMVENATNKPVYDFGTSTTAKTITLAIKNASAVDFTPTLPTFSNPEFTPVTTAGTGTCGFVTGGAVTTLTTGAEACTFQAKWTPVTTTPGTRTVVVTSADLTTPATKATMVMYGRVAGAAMLWANPSALDFGNVSENNNATGTLSVVVTNIGDSATSGDVGPKKTGAGNGDLTFVSGCTGGGIAAGDFCTLVVRVNPTTLVAGDTTITVQSPPPTATAVESVTIHATWQGVNTNPPAITRDPLGTVTFPGTVPVLATSDPIPVTLTNGATSLPTGPLSFAITGDFAVQAATTGTGCGALAHTDGLAAGESCTVTVTFTPKTLGGKSGSLTVTSLATAVTIPLTGTPRAALQLVAGNAGHAEALTSEDPKVNNGCSTWTDATGGNNAICAYPTTKVNPAPAKFASETFIFRNADGAPPTGLLLALLTGSDAGNYDIVYDTCTETTGLSGAAACRVTVRFVPTDTAAENSVHLTVSGTPGDSITVDLTGRGN